MLAALIILSLVAFVLLILMLCEAAGSADRLDRMAEERQRQEAIRRITVRADSMRDDLEWADRMAAQHERIRSPADVQGRATMSEELVTGAIYRYVPQPDEITDEAIERAFQAGARWFAEHPDGASSDDEWRDFHRAALIAADLRS